MELSISPGELLGVIFGVLTFLTAFVNMIKAVVTEREVKNIKVELNGRLTQMLELTKDAAKAEGKIEGFKAGVDSEKAKILEALTETKAETKENKE